MLWPTFKPKGKKTNISLILYICVSWRLTKPGPAQFDSFAQKPQTADSLVLHEGLCFKKMKTYSVLPDSFCFGYVTLSGFNDEKLTLTQIQSPTTLSSPPLEMNEGAEYACNQWKKQVLIKVLSFQEKSPNLTPV